jgi:hypothetical protein
MGEGVHVVKFAWVLLVLVTMSVITGCEPKKYADVTGQEPYASIVGYKFKSKIELLALGITLDQNYKGDADYILLMARPGVSGPQVKFRQTLLKGIEFTVVGVLKSDWIRGGRILYQVESQQNLSLEKHPMLIKVFDDINSSNRGLSTEEFIFLGQ